MTLTLLDLYNTTASQEWAMYDSDATTDSEFEDSLVLAINKAILEIYSSFEFPFRERTHIILTLPKVDTYNMPSGIIKKTADGKYKVKYNSCQLEYVEDDFMKDVKIGVPSSFCIKSDKIVLNPMPIEKGIVTIEYLTLAIGESATGEEIYSLKKADDSLLVPIYLEEIMKEAIITRTMLNTIASETDENYSAYKKQADKAFKLLVKYSKGLQKDKVVKV